MQNISHSQSSRISCLSHKYDPKFFSSSPSCYHTHNWHRMALLLMLIPQTLTLSSCNSTLPFNYKSNLREAITSPPGRHRCRCLCTDMTFRSYWWHNCCSSNRTYKKQWSHSQSTLYEPVSTKLACPKYHISISGTYTFINYCNSHIGTKSLGIPAHYLLQ